jgi:hypothetical protein
MLCQKNIADLVKVAFFGVKIDCVREKKVKFSSQKTALVVRGVNFFQKIFC